MGEYSTLYKELGKAVLDIATEKHADIDYSELKEVLEYDRLAVNDHL